jgi:hypothetical protein
VGEGVPSQLVKKQRVVGPDAWNALARRPVIDVDEEDGEEETSPAEEAHHSAKVASMVPATPMPAFMPLKHFPHHTWERPRHDPTSIPSTFQDYRQKSEYGSINAILHSTRLQRTHMPASATSSPPSSPIRHQHSSVTPSPLRQQSIPQYNHDGNQQKEEDEQGGEAPEAKRERGYVAARYEDINKLLGALVLGRRHKLETEQPEDQ